MSRGLFDLDLLSLGPLRLWNGDLEDAVLACRLNRRRVHCHRQFEHAVEHAVAFGHVDALVLLLGLDLLLGTDRKEISV